jgi:hypothetical protein
MTSLPSLPARALRSEIRRASRERRRAATALRHLDTYGDPVISAVLNARFRRAISRCAMLERLAQAQIAA